MSSTLNLFGFPLAFEDSGTTYDTLTHSGKTYVCKVEGAFKNPERTLFELKVDGELPSGRLSFHQQFACEVNGGVIRLTGSGAILARPQVTLSLGTAYPSSGVTVAPDPSGACGVVVVDRSSPLINYLSDTTNNDGIENVSIWPVRWGDTSIFFDIPNAWCRAVPSKTDVIFDDVFVDADGSGVVKQQSLRVHEMIIASDALAIHAAPAGGALMLHPDILNTRSALPFDGDQEVRNDFLYQYALVNGRLSWNIPFGRERDGSQLRWASAGGGGEPGMVVFRHRDEHGNPIVLVPHDGTQGFRIGFRAGVQFEVASSYEPAEWELTNRGACVVLDRDANGARIPLDCELRGMDPIVLYGRPRKTEPDENDDPFDDPYWLIGGKVVYASRVPVELHGLLKGTYMRCPPDVAQDAWTRGLTGHAAQIVVTPVEGPNQQEVYHKSEILLTPASSWDVAAQIEERRVYNGISPTLGTPAIPKRVAKSAKQDAVRLPLIDTAYALANLAGVGRENTDGDKLGDAPILREGVNWLNELDGQFSGMKIYAVPELEANTHVNGRGLVPAPAQPFETVITLPPTTARSVDATGLPGPTMLANVHEKHGGVGADTAGAVVRSFESTFHYGGTRDPQAQNDVITDHKRIDALLSELRDDFFEKFLDPDRLNSPEKEAVIVLKRYLVKDRPYTDPDGEGDAPDAFFSDMLRRMIDLLENEVPIPGIDDDELDFLRMYLNTIDAQLSRISGAAASMRTSWAGSSASYSRRRTGGYSAARSRRSIPNSGT